MIDVLMRVKKLGREREGRREKVRVVHVGTRCVRTTDDVTQNEERGEKKVRGELKKTKTKTKSGRVKGARGRRVRARTMVQVVCVCRDRLRLPFLACLQNTTLTTQPADEL